MRPIRYYDVVSHRRNPYHLRRELVQAALREGISVAARSFHTTRKTVRKWLRRFQEGGLAGLKEKSRAPHLIPHKTPPDVEVVVVKLRQRMPAFGPRRLKVTYGLTPSTWAIARILRQHGLSRKSRRKAARRRDLRRQKAALAPFQHLQFDVKDLSDIPAYWRKGSTLPRYQHTCRDVRTGAAWVSYALQNTSTHAALFAGLVLGQLARYGVDLSQVTTQTDNGSEYGGMMRKRGTDAFTAVVEAAGATPPRARGVERAVCAAVLALSGPGTWGGPRGRLRLDGGAHPVSTARVRGGDGASPMAPGPKGRPLTSAPLNLSCSRARFAPIFGSGLATSPVPWSELLPSKQATRVRFPSPAPARIQRHNVRT